MSTAGPPQGAQHRSPRGEGTPVSTAPTTSPLVSLQGVSVVFGGRVRALDDVTLEIDQGDIVGLWANPVPARPRCAACWWG